MLISSRFNHHIDVTAWAPRWQYWATGGRGCNGHNIKLVIMIYDNTGTFRIYSDASGTNNFSMKRYLRFPKLEGLRIKFDGLFFRIYYKLLKIGLYLFLKLYLMRDSLSTTDNRPLKTWTIAEEEGNLEAVTISKIAWLKKKSNFSLSFLRYFSTFIYTFPTQGGAFLALRLGSSSTYKRKIIFECLFFIGSGGRRLLA